MATLGGALPETRELRCPYCKNDRTLAAGRVIAIEWTIKEERQCEVCGTAFWFLRKAR